MNNNELKQKRLKQNRLRCFVECLKLYLYEIENIIRFCENLSETHKFTLHKCDIAAIGYYLWQLVNHRDRYGYMEYEETFIDWLVFEGSDEKNDGANLENILASLNHITSINEFCEKFFQNGTFEWLLLDEGPLMMIDIDIRSAAKLIDQPWSQVAIALSVISELIVLHTLLDIEPNKRVKTYLKFLVFSQSNRFIDYPQFQVLNVKEVTDLKYATPKDILSSAKNILKSLFTSESEWREIEYLLFKISGTAYALSRDYEERSADHVKQGREFLSQDYAPGFVFWTLFDAVNNENTPNALGKKFENFYFLLYKVLIYKDH